MKQYDACVKLLAALIIAAASIVPAVAGSVDPPPLFGGKTQLPLLPSPSGDPSDGSRESSRTLVRAEAARAGIPPDLADAVAEVESGYHFRAVGAAGEIGLMQVMPATAQMLGFTGTVSELAVPEVNVRFGVAYLARAWRLAGGDICTAAMKYRAGHGETRFSFKSVDYCISVRAKLAARGYPVTGAVPVPTFGEPNGRAGSGRRLRQLAFRGPDLNSINKRLRLLTDAITARTAIALR
jgi:soluble lytic murein transglycosylase-like protein